MGKEDFRHPAFQVQVWNECIDNDTKKYQDFEPKGKF